MPSAFFPSSNSPVTAAARHTAAHEGSNSSVSSKYAVGRINGVGSNISGTVQQQLKAPSTSISNNAKLSTVSPAPSASGRPKSKLSFPSSRKYLWDRTACAATQYVQPKVRSLLLSTRVLLVLHGSLYVYVCESLCVCVCVCVWVNTEI